MSSHLSRFVDAQDALYESVLKELSEGKKVSHWMWFIFPQIAGLGTSGTARYYSIRDRYEAVSFLMHPLLGHRLRESFRVILNLEGRSAFEIFGTPDDLKLRSCATLFASVASGEPEFQIALDKFFDGVSDPKTLKILASDRSSSVG